MQEVLAGQSNILGMPLVAKASGNPIVSGTVNFYLVANDGANAGKWYRGADTSWQAAEAIAGVATHRADGHWYRSLPSGVWTRNVAYTAYARESGNLHIPVEDHVLCIIQDLDVILKAWCTGKWQMKSGETDIYEVLDEDGSTPIMEVTVSQTTPYKVVTIL